MNLSKIALYGGAVAVVGLVAVGLNLLQKVSEAPQSSAASSAATSTVTSAEKSGPLLIDAKDPLLVSMGAQIYANNCSSCHGANLEGQPDWRKRGADGLLPAPPHDENGHSWHHADALLFALTKDGPAAQAGGDYKSSMPGFGGILNDAEIEAVLA